MQVDRASLRDAAIIAAGFALAAGAVFIAKNYSLWILVPLPAAVAVVYHVLSLSSRFDSRKAVVDEYQKFTERFDQAWTGDPAPLKVTEDVSANVERHKPSLASILWSAALLTAVFAIPAVISSGGRALAPATDPKLDNALAAVRKAQSVAGAKEVSVKAIQESLASAGKSLAAAKNGLLPWQLGLVYSGLGVWVLVVMRTIGRIHAGGLNARFLITASLRAAAAMMLGFFAGATSILSITLPADLAAAAGPPAYFLIGIFYPLFFEQLRDEAYRVFKRNKSITNELPTNWIDGIDDDTQDILTEANVLSVQHLATADPGVLTVRTLLPFNRVLDLIDQAILISYCRETIVELRRFGIRGVIDFVAAVEPVLRNDKTLQRKRSEESLRKLAEKLEVPLETLLTIGESVYGDYRVNLLIRLWQHSVRQAEGYSVQREQQAFAPAGEPHLPIVGDEMSFVAFTNRRIDAELRREARERAVRFREENPDAAEPSGDWMTASFTDAYTAARQRATIGANPNAGAKAREVYEQAFLGAL